VQKASKLPICDGQQIDENLTKSAGNCIMLSKYRLLLATLMIAILAACAGQQFRQSLKVGAGDSKETLIHNMGMPLDRQMQGSAEAWQYGSIAAVGICEYTIFWLSQGRVQGITSYRNPSVMGCRVGLKTISWEQAPDGILEVRSR
jgi:hypothetical protein